MVIANFRIVNELIGPVLLIITLDVNENAMLDHLLFATDLFHFVGHGVRIILTARSYFYGFPTIELQEDFELENICLQVKPSPSTAVNLIAFGFQLLT